MDDSGNRAQAYWRTVDTAQGTTTAQCDSRDSLNSSIPGAEQCPDECAGQSAKQDVKRDTELATELDQDKEQGKSTNATNSPTRIPLGMDSFKPEDRDSFGRNVRLAMAFMDGSGKPAPSARPESAMPHKATAIAQRLRTLGREITSHTADQLELLVRFDELEGWRTEGARHCVAWMNLELGIGQALGWEYLRVGRQLRRLPITNALFRSGSLSWSKVRLISRVAHVDNEGGLCHSALDASVSEVERVCNEYRWQLDSQGKDDDSVSNAENARYLQQFNARSLTWNGASNGNTVIRLSLPSELAQAYLQSVEHSLQQLEVSTETMPQRRADAAILMAESSLQNTGNSLSRADRYQVIVSVDASQLQDKDAVDTDKNEATSTASNRVDTVQPEHTIPPKRPTLPGAEPVARETARRIACDCSVSIIGQTNNEPLSIGRKSRLWTPAMARAIKVRDQHCQYPGCTQTRHLQIHHIKHWADGGTTSVDNGVCLCQKHHVIVHEGGYRIERVSDQANGLKDQFNRQRMNSESAICSEKNTQCSANTEPCKNHDHVNKVESMLRNSRDSFDVVRRLSPTRFRFRVVDPNGRDIRDTAVIDSVSSRITGNSTHVNYSTCVDTDPATTKHNGDIHKPGIAENAADYA